jgi:hypothetical protein
MGQIKTPILLKSSLKLISYKCSSFFIDSMLVMFGGRVFQQTFLWVPNVLP